MLISQRMPARSMRRIGFLAACCFMMVVFIAEAQAQDKTKNRKRKKPSRAAVEVTFPPRLPGGSAASDRSNEFLKPPPTLRSGVAVAKTPPTVDFLYFPGQNYEGKPWSNWGDGVAAGGKYYTAIGDHLAINWSILPRCSVWQRATTRPEKSTGRGTDGSVGTGTGLVFEYDPKSKTIRSRIDLGSDGWLYFATHRGSKRATTNDNHYKGDWIMRCDPKTGTSEVVAHGPVPNHAIPTSVLDPDRLIFYGATAAGLNSDHQGDRFFAYDVKNKKLLYDGPDGPSRYMIFARSTGRVYYVPGRDEGALMRFDPAKDQSPVKVPGSHIGIRAATAETSDGFVYTVSLGQRSADAAIWSFNTKTEACKKIGTAAVGSQAYVASIDVSPNSRYLYYVPGAHGGSERDGSAVVQFDVKTGKKKVIAFLDPFYTKKYGLTLKGTYSTAIDSAGDKLYITWNVSRGTRAWDCCGLTVVHIPETERRP